MNFIIIPIKSLELAKLRLAPILNSDQRKRLCINMFKDVLKAIKETKSKNKILTISSDPLILELARHNGEIISEQTETEINRSINLAINKALEEGAESVLIIPGDIPLIIPEDIDGIFKYKIKPQTVIITPSLRKNGTNLLFLKPPDIIKIQYGKNSFQKHIEKVRNTQNQHLIIHNSQNIALDIDLPEDLFLFLKKPSQTLTYQYLKQQNLVIS